MGNPNKTESEATWAAKEGEIKTVGEGGGGLRFLERAISGSVALLTAIEASFCILCESESAKFCWDGGIVEAEAEAPSSV